MAKNALGLKPNLHRLKPGRSEIVGPASRPNAVSAKISRAKRLHPELVGAAEFDQRQFILVDPKTLEAFKVYLVTRTK